MSEREKLKRDLEIIQYQSHNVVADLIHYIEQDRRRILSPLIEWKEATDIATIYEGAGLAIEATLKLAGMEDTK